VTSCDDKAPESMNGEDSRLASEPKIVFLSYSHDSDEHAERVLRLSESLRRSGFDTRLDQYVNGSPDEGWPRWMYEQLEAADRVLLICTETYYRRFWGREEPEKGKGVDWEGAIITQGLYASRSRTTKFVPVLFDANQERFIPEPLAGQSYYLVSSKEGFKDLRDALLEQKGFQPGPIGRPDEKVRPIADPLFDVVTNPIRHPIPTPTPTPTPQDTEDAKDGHPLRRYLFGLGVSGAVGSAPLLGLLKAPGFVSLLALIPEESKIPLISASASLMGLVAVAVQFYGGEKIDRKFLRKYFPILVVVILASLIALIVLYHSVVPIGTSNVRVFIGWSRLPGCECEGPDNSKCVADLVQDLQTCWSDSSIGWVKNLYYLSYLLGTGGFGALIGLLVLQRTARRQEVRRRAAANRVPKPKSAPLRRAVKTKLRNTSSEPTPSVDGAASKPPTLPADEKNPET